MGYRARGNRSTRSCRERFEEILMPVLVVGSEKNIAALRPRLFSGKPSTAAVRRVNEALRAANPGVDLDALSPGTVLRVPDLPEIQLGAELALDESATSFVSDLHTMLAAALEQLGATADERDRNDLVEQKELARLLDAREVQAAAADDKALALELEETRRALSQAETDLKVRTEARRRAQKDWAAALEALQAGLR
jgi:hypothetical protein